MVFGEYAYHLCTI